MSQLQSPNTDLTNRAHLDKNGNSKPLPSPLFPYVTAKLFSSKATSDNAERTYLWVFLHRHGGMDAIAARFITTGGHDPSAAPAPDNERFTLETTIPEKFYGHEEGIKIQMEYCLIVHESNLGQYIDYIIVNILTCS